MHPPIDTEDTSESWQLRRACSGCRDVYTDVENSLKNTTSFRYTPKSGLLHQALAPFPVPGGPSTPFSMVAVPADIPTNPAQSVPFLHICTTLETSRLFHDDRCDGWGDSSVWFRRAFSRWLVVLSLSSRACWPPVYFLWQTSVQVACTPELTVCFGSEACVGWAICCHSLLPPGCLRLCWQPPLCSGSELMSPHWFLLLPPFLLVSNAKNNHHQEQCQHTVYVFFCKF